MKQNSKCKCKKSYQFKTHHSTKTAKIFWVTLDVAMHGQLMDALCVAPSKVTQKIFAVLVE